MRDGWGAVGISDQDKFPTLAVGEISDSVEPIRKGLRLETLSPEVKSFRIEKVKLEPGRVGAGIGSTYAVVTSDCSGTGCSDQEKFL